jgi:hypothetical protein
MLGIFLRVPGAYYRNDANLFYATIASGTETDITPTGATKSLLSYHPWEGAEQ